MSEYNASAPVVAKKILPRMKIPALLTGLNRISIAYTGLNAPKMAGYFSRFTIPITAKKVNQINITGPNELPMIPVPNLWIKNKTKSTHEVMIKTFCCELLNEIGPKCWPFKPSRADVTETAGVKVPSANNAAPPIKAGQTSHFAFLLTKAKRRIFHLHRCYQHAL